MNPKEDILPSSVSHAATKKQNKKKEESHVTIKLSVSTCMKKTSYASNSQKNRYRTTIVHSIKLRSGNVFLSQVTETH